jgi:pimeloyl-ACP methyl ester carboxylesterase
MGQQIDAQTVLVPDAAHYPQTQRPGLVAPPVVAFLGGLRSGDGWQAPRA